MNEMTKEIPAAGELSQLAALAESAVSSKLFGIASREAALMIMLTGRSLGIDPVAAMRGTHIVSGKSVLSSDMMVGIVRKSGVCESWTVIESTHEKCTIETRRKGDDTPVRHTWTVEMAKRANLAGKGTWAAYPHAMLRARCSAELARMVYPDFLFGVYAEGEIPEESRRSERATVTHDAHALEAGPSAFDGFCDDCNTEQIRMVLDAWAHHSARLTQAGAIDDAKAHVTEWLSARLAVLSATEVQTLLANAAQATRGFCELYDRLASAPTADDALTAWRSRGDMGGKWHAHTARQMTARALKSFSLSRDEIVRMLDDDGPDGGPGGGERVTEPSTEPTAPLSTVPATVTASNDAAAVATLARLAAVEARTHLYRSAQKHAAEILSNPLVREVYAHTARRIERVDTTDTRTPAELDAAARDLVTMWATTATAQSNDSSKAA